MCSRRSDSIKAVLVQLEKTETEPAGDDSALTQRLERWLPGYGLPTPLSVPVITGAPRPRAGDVRRNLPRFNTIGTGDAPRAAPVTPRTAPAVPDTPAVSEAAPQSPAGDGAEVRAR